MKGVKMEKRKTSDRPGVLKGTVLAGLFFFLSFTGFSQNCPSSAELMDACGTSFSTSNSGNDASCACKGWNQSGGFNNDLDCNLNTNEAGCNGGSCDGADVGYSVENDLYYKFCPQTTGSWDISITGSSCNSSDGWQYAIFQGNQDSLHTLLDGGTNGMNLSGTQNTSINVTQTTECYFLQIDGYGGTECNFDVTLTAPSGACTLPVELKSFEASREDPLLVTISWRTHSEKASERYDVMRRCSENGRWTKISSVDAAGTTPNGASYVLEDRSPVPGKACYYKLIQVDRDGASEKYGPVVADPIPFSEKEVRARYNVYGEKVGPDYNGTRIIEYEDGTTRKVAGP